MGIVRKKREVVGIRRNGHVFVEVRKYINGAWRSVWQAIQSCFGRGFWSNLKSWRNDNGWRNF